MFGDLHLRDHAKVNRKTLPIYKWLQYTINSNPDKKFDVFLESRFQRSGYEDSYDLKNYDFHQQDWLTNTWYFFQQQLLHKNRKAIPNARVHYTDMRTIFRFKVRIDDVSHDSDLPDIVEGVEEVLMYFSMIDVRLTTRAFLFRKSKSPAQNDSLQDWVDYVLHKVNKQIARIKDRHVKRKLMEYFQNEWSSTYIDPKLIRNVCEYLLEWLPKRPDLLKVGVSFKILKVWMTKMLEDRFALLMDMYLMGRTFSQRFSNNIIIYAGEHHNMTYRGLFDALDIQPVAPTKFSWNQVLPMVQFDWK